jgi:hypothetical protein
MIGPLVLVIGVGLLVEHVRQLRSALAVCGAFLVSFIAVNIPWLRYLLTVPVLAVTPAGTELSFSARLLELVRPASFRDFRYFLDDDYGAFARALPAPLRSTTLALAVTWILGAIVLFGLCVHARDSRPHVRRIALLGLATAVIYPIFFQWAGFGPHPHYMFPVGWVTVAGVALAIDAGSRLRWARVWPVAITTSITALNLIVLFTLARFIIERGGTRGIHYGTPVALQAETVETLCARRGSPIYVENATLLFEAVLRQHASRVPQCLGRPVRLCKRPRCRDAPPSSVVARIEYAEPEGGRLSVSFADAEPADRQ